MDFLFNNNVRFCTVDSYSSADDCLLVENQILRQPAYLVAGPEDFEISANG